MENYFDEGTNEDGADVEENEFLQEMVEADLDRILAEYEELFSL